MGMGGISCVQEEGTGWSRSLVTLNRFSIISPFLSPTHYAGALVPVTIPDPSEGCAMEINLLLLGFPAPCTQDP